MKYVCSIYFKKLIIIYNLKRNSLSSSIQNKCILLVTILLNIISDRDNRETCDINVKTIASFCLKY